MKELDDKLYELISVAVGEASICWESLDEAGEFDASHAKEVVDLLFKGVKDLYNDVEEKAWMYDELRD